MLKRLQCFVRICRHAATEFSFLASTIYCPATLYRLVARLTRGFSPGCKRLAPMPMALGIAAAGASAQYEGSGKDEGDPRHPLHVNGLVRQAEQAEVVYC